MAVYVECTLFMHLHTVAVYADSRESEFDWQVWTRHSEATGEPQHRHSGQNELAQIGIWLQVQAMSQIERLVQVRFPDPDSYILEVAMGTVCYI